jgi:hypothetical protein
LSDTGSDSDSDLSEEDRSIEAAIPKYLHIARAELASFIGLAFKHIRDFYRRASQHRQQSQQDN